MNIQNRQLRLWLRALLIWLPAVLVGSCSEDAGQAETAQGLDLSGVLGGDATSGFLRADAPREFSFPADHGPHPGFRNEWWYLTGNLDTAEGRRFGYQVTFFNAAQPPRPEQDSAAEETSDAQPLTQQLTVAEAASAWHSERIWMAHFALSDVEAGEHHAVERFSRENPGLAGAALDPFRVWLEDWQLSGNASRNVSIDASPNDVANRAATDSGFPWQLEVVDGELALNLQLQPLKPPVLQGEGGLSRKSPAAGNASYYYSLTRLQTTGELRVGNETFTIAGASWLDREWSTSALAADQTGWDWFSLQFDAGQELMYYQLRGENGTVHPNSLGNWTDVAAQQTVVASDQIALQELATWTSPAGITYTTAWQLDYAGQSWEVRAVLEDQWMDLTLPYWEGAVDIVDQQGESVGRGYLEMVRE